MITQSFDPETPPVMSIGDFYGEPRQLLDTCIVTFSWKIRDALLEQYACEEIATITAANGSTPIYRLFLDGKPVAFYLSPIGSAGAAQYCIECNWLTGAKNFILFGSAGSLDRKKTTGKFVLPTKSYRDEGMSYHYAPPADYISVKNWEKMAKFFEELDLPYVCGPIWTTDAFLRETVGQTALRRSEGCIAVEMEVAGVQAVCDYHGFELYDFLVTGDVLSPEGYDRGTLTGANHNLDKLLIALELAKRL